jgi:hypothetical protein
MTGHFVLSPRAQADLDDIWDYTADRWGLDQAETYTRDIWQRTKPSTIMSFHRSLVSRKYRWLRPSAAVRQAQKARH